MNQSLVGAISNVTDKINPITKRNYTIPLACFVDANWDNNPRLQVHRLLNAYGLGGGRWGWLALLLTILCIEWTTICEYTEYYIVLYTTHMYNSCNLRNSKAHNGLEKKFFT